MKAIRGTIHLWVAALLVSLSIGLSSCEKDRNEEPTPTPLEPATLTIDPPTVSLYPGDRIQLVARLGDAPCLVSYTSSNPEIVSVDSEGRVAYVAEGEATIIAISQSDTAYVPTTALPTPEIQPFLPYLRFFDGKEAIIAYEESLGHKLIEEDAIMGSLEFAPTKEESYYFTHITYSIRNRIQIFAKDVTVMENPKIKEFLESNGFMHTGDQYGYMGAYKSPKETVNCFTIISNLHTSYHLFPGICFTVNPPQPDAEIPYPNLVWGSTVEQVREFEAARGYTFNSERDITATRRVMIFGLKKTEEEFTRYYIPRYVFEDGKLIGVTLLVAPIELYIKSMGDGFDVQPGALEMIEKTFTEQTKVSKGTTNVNVYKDPTGQRKFFFEQWTLKIGQEEHKAAGLVFLPYDGPDYIDLELRDEE